MKCVPLKQICANMHVLESASASFGCRQLLQPSRDPLNSMSKPRDELRCARTHLEVRMSFCASIIRDGFLRNTFERNGLLSTVLPASLVVVGSTDAAVVDGSKSPLGVANGVDRGAGRPEGWS